jgi:hypothetical protein
LVFEGPKCVELAVQLGYVATTSPHGARSPKHADWKPLACKTVSIFPDHDEPGKKYATMVADILLALGCTVKIVHLPGLADREDFAEWLERCPKNWEDDRKRAELQRLIDEAPILTTPKKREHFANHHEESTKDEHGNPDRITVPWNVHKIDGSLNTIIGDWPKRISNNLFWETAEHEILYLESSTQFYALVDRFADVNWKRGPRLVTQERYYEHRRMTSPAFNAVESLPHWPPLPGTYYVNRPLQEPGKYLDLFLDKLKPETALDRELIKAFLLTLFWGGLPGSRPAWLFTGPDNDPNQGRGLGKTTLIKLVFDNLLGGYLEVSPHEKIEDIKTRLLSPEGSDKRAILIDNLKTLRFSWAELEGEITSSVISGRQLYKGEGQRPNTLNWAITLNGATLSKDMAQRVIPVHLARPVFVPAWEEETRDFLQQHRWEIIAEIGHILSAERPTITAATRWSAWERDVLFRTKAPVSTQALIVERQNAMDDDEDDKARMVAKFVEKLRAAGLDHETCHVFIPSAVVDAWVSEAEGELMKARSVNPLLRQLQIPQLVKPKDNNKRGWYWIGPKTTLRTAEDFKPPAF